jgi:hypothetical protein
VDAVQSLAVAIARLESGLFTSQHALHGNAREMCWGRFVEQVRKKGQLRDGRGFDEI